jgi:iron(III) transport system substrate-binding protein
VFWSGDPVRPFSLVKRGFVEAHVPAAAAGVPASFRAADGTWTGVGARARVLLVNTDRLEKRALPTSVRALADPAWKGQAAMANPLFGTTTMHVAALFASWGESKAREFLEAVKANGTRIASSNGEVKRLVVAGEVALGLIDTDDAHEAVAGGARAQIVYPDQDADGVLVMPTTVVKIKGGPNAASAELAIEFLVSTEAEQMLTVNGAHMPLRASVKAPAGVKSVESLKAMAVDYAKIGAEMERIQPWLREWVGF